MTTSATGCPYLAGWEPFSQEFNRNPDPLLKRSHDEAPVFYYEPLDAWFVTKYEDVARVLSNAREFSSRSLRTIPVPEEHRGKLPEKPMDNAFINTNDPQHKVARRIANKGFTRPRLEAMQPMVEEVVEEYLDAIADRGEADIMKDFAYPVTLRVITEILGLPVSDMPLMRQWTEDMFAIMSAGNADEEDAPVRPHDPEDVKARYGRLAEAWSYFSTVIEDRRSSPREDFMTTFATAKDADGNWAMTDDEIKTHMLELVAAGNDTTANLIGNMVMFFREHPEKLDGLKADPDLWPNAVEEALRRRPTSPHMMRIAVDDVELSGVTVPAGSTVVVNLTGANHDSAHFENPWTLDIHRANAQDHLAFGKGVHMCLGAPLARMEAKIAMQRIYERLPNIRVPEQELSYIPNMTVQTLTSLQVTWDA